MFNKLNENSRYMDIFTGISFTFLFFSMVYNLMYSAPWGDEWVEYNVSQLNLVDGSMYNSIIGTFQPPLYNFLMHFWLKLNNSILAFRLFNVVLGVISSIALFKGLINITNRFIANISIILLGTTYTYIYCIQECSEYALMLTFLFWAIYFFIECDRDNTRKKQIFFILMCVGAMYSQYGAFFIVLPLLLFNFIRNYKSDIKWIFKAYLLSFIFFVIPLYHFFAKIQIGNNQITNNSNISISFELIKNLPLIFGDILAYFYNMLYKTEFTSNCFRLLGIVILISAVYLISNKKVSFEKKYLLLTMVISYTLFYFLVSYNIYAMIHPNESLGFTSRYTYFFMPLFCFVFPIIINEIIKISKQYAIKCITSIATILIVILLFISTYPSILNNWHKAYDDEFAKIWGYNSGYNDTTYLIGGLAGTAFNYYVSKSGCELQQNVFYEDSIDLNNLPERFWLWRTNWANNIWQETVDYAKASGYLVEIYANHSSGQLARCTKKLN